MIGFVPQNETPLTMPDDLISCAGVGHVVELEDPDGYQLWFGQPTNEAPTAHE